MTQMKSRLFLTRSPDHYSGVKASLKPFRQSLASAVSRIPSLVIKINLVITRTPAYGEGVELATTPIEACRSFLDFIRPFYCGKIIIAEQAAWGDTKEGFKHYGFTKLAKEYPRVELLDLGDDETVSKKVKYPGGELILPLSRALVDAPFLVSIVRPKTHCTVVMTAGIKNVLVGAIQGYANKRKIHSGLYIHYMLSSLAEHAYPDFTVIDGTVGMQGGGPVRGTEIRAGWAMSSFDALAADSLAAHLMGFDAEEVGYLSLLGEKGVGTLYPSDKIQILGALPESLMNRFTPHRSFKKARMWRIGG